MRTNFGVLVACLLVCIFSSFRATASSNEGTLTVGISSESCSGIRLPIEYGFVGATSGYAGYGSYSPTGLTGGEAVFAVYDSNSYCENDAGSYFDVSGFSSDPGSDWLTSITCNGVEQTPSAGSYFYSAGYAYWMWSTTFGFSSKVGDNVSCTIVHN
jgi:hypothetical protein